VSGHFDAARAHSTGRDFHRFGLSG